MNFKYSHPNPAPSCIWPDFCIEVLFHAGAAQHGSDAIAGVIKKGADGGEAEVVYCRYAKGDGEQTVRPTAISPTVRLPIHAPPPASARAR